MSDYFYYNKTGTFSKRKRKRKHQCTLFFILTMPLTAAFPYSPNLCQQNTLYQLGGCSGGGGGLQMTTHLKLAGQATKITRPKNISNPYLIQLLQTNQVYKIKPIFQCHASGVVSSGSSNYMVDVRFILCSQLLDCNYNVISITNYPNYQCASNFLPQYIYSRSKNSYNPIPSCSTSFDSNNYCTQNNKLYFCYQSVNQTNVLQVDTNNTFPIAISSNTSCSNALNALTESSN